MDLTLKDIRKLVILSLFSDDTLMEILSLKGGNAIELAHNLHSRASIDIDFSMEKDFIDYNLTPEEVLKKLKLQLDFQFNKYGLCVFDEKIIEKPKINISRRYNWGGYNISFKFIEQELFETLKNDIDSLRRQASIVTENSNKRTFEIDISKYEYIDSSQLIELDDYTIRVYTPLMIVFEKLRAICQQTEEYKKKMLCTTSSRARDFYDIYMVSEELIPQSELINLKSIEILKAMFKVKDVPLSLLLQIKNEDVYNLHSLTYNTLKASVPGNVNLKEFSFYYNYVLNLIEKLVPYINPEG